ncbi:MAG: DNA-binding protein [Anaerolineae bacterium]|nr:DNA-binding protein [Anaerolineae bacterium]
MSRNHPTNDEIAAILDDIGDLLEKQESNAFRVRAYHQGATSIRATKESVAVYVHKGETEALEAIPNIGEGLARLIEEYVTTGRSNLLDRLQGEITPESVFNRVPGIGAEFAHRIADQLDIQTLEELEQAAHDGRLGLVKGFGPRRVEAIKASLAGLLGQAAARRRQSSQTLQKPDEPSIQQLLEIDAEYRRRGEAGQLKMIAPRRFNPEQKAWLPVLHVDREGWSYTVLYSNTARAHELDKTHDWVVIYFERNGKEKQRTVVTGTGDELKGKRIVRGREDECLRYYAAKADESANRQRLAG